MTGEPKPITNADLKAHGLESRMPPEVIESVRRAEALRQQTVTGTEVLDAPAVIPPETESELDKMRKISAEKQQYVINKKREEAGIGDDEPEPVYAAQQDAQKQGDFVPPWANAEAISMIKGRTFQLYDGRVIQMGPPATPVELIIMEMLSTNADDALQLQSRAGVARIMNYIRFIDGKKMPKALTTWFEVFHLYQSLGELGYKACSEVYSQTWPNTGGVYWQDIKKPS